MKIVIEKHTRRSGNEVKVFYRVRYRCWFFWRYVNYIFRDGDPEVKEFSCLEEAVKVAKDLRLRKNQEAEGIVELDENGEPLDKYWTN